MLCLNMRELFETRESCMRGSNNHTYTSTVKYTHTVSVLIHTHFHTLTHTHTQYVKRHKNAIHPPYCSD